MKICTKCCKLKSSDKFYKDSRDKTGLRSECKDCSNLYFTKYRKTDSYRLSQKKYKHSDGIYNSLKKNKKGRKWESLVGYTLNDLMIHLEKQFKPWMSWENWGKGKEKWNIDHIKPKSLFHYTSPEDKEFKECWALSNLQPLEEIENIRKSNKFNLD